MKDQKRGCFTLSIILVIPTIITLFSSQNVQVAQHQETGYIVRGYFFFDEITQKELASIPGISKKQAELINQRRDQFKSVDDFRKIKGIGVKKVMKIKRYIHFRGLNHDRE